MKATQTMQSFFDALNRRDWATFSTLLAEDFSWTEPFLGDKVGMGRDSFLKDAQSFVENVPDVSFVVGSVLAEGKRAALEVTAERKQSGKRTTYALFVETNEAGQLRRIREYYDRKMLMGQLGLESE